MEKFPVHIGKDGSFQELAHDYDVTFGQLSILRVNPKCKRGEHYHSRKSEWFCVVNGCGELILEDVETKKRTTYYLNGFKHRKFIEIPPKMAHVVRNMDPYADLEILIIISEVYNPEDPDTFSYGIE